MTEKNLSLYEISHELKILDNLLEEAGGDVTGEKGQILEKWFNDYKLAEQKKVDSFGEYYTNLVSKIQVLKEEEERLAERRRKIQNHAKYLKEKVKEAMDLRSIVKIEGLKFTFSLAKNGGKPPVQLRVPPEELPERFVRVVLEPDLEKIREALEAGDEEAKKLADFGETGYSVRIR